MRGEAVAAVKATKALQIIGLYPKGSAIVRRRAKRYEREAAWAAVRAAQAQKSTADLEQEKLAADAAEFADMDRRRDQALFDGLPPDVQDKVRRVAGLIPNFSMAELAYRLKNVGEGPTLAWLDKKASSFLRKQARNRERARG